MNISIERKIKKLEQNKKHSIREGKKNSHLYINIETAFKIRLNKEAEEKDISLSELCRQKLRDDTQLDRIEGKLDAVLGNLNYTPV